METLNNYVFVFFFYLFNKNRRPEMHTLEYNDILELQSIEVGKCKLYLFWENWNSACATNMTF